MITLTFDDGWRSAKDEALPLLDSKNLKASFYIITDCLKENSFPAYIKKFDVLELYESGYEIGSHTKSHPHLSKLTQEKIIDEVVDSKSVLLSLGITSQTFVYPYGDFNQTVTKEVMKAGFIGARTVQRGFNDQHTNPYLLKCQAVYRWTPFFLIKHWINKAEKKNLWLILMFHQIDTTYGFYGTTPKMLKKIADYLSSKKIQTITMLEGIKQLNLSAQDASIE